MQVTVRSFKWQSSTADGRLAFNDYQFLMDAGISEGTALPLVQAVNGFEKAAMVAGTIIAAYVVSPYPVKTVIANGDPQCVAFPGSMFGEACQRVSRGTPEDDYHLLLRKVTTSGRPGRLALPFAVESADFFRDDAGRVHLRPLPWWEDLRDFHGAALLGEAPGQFWKMFVGTPDFSEDAGLNIRLAVDLQPSGVMYMAARRRSGLFQRPADAYHLPAAAAAVLRLIWPSLLEMRDHYGTDADFQSTRRKQQATEALSAAQTVCRAVKQFIDSPGGSGGSGSGAAVAFRYGPRVEAVATLASSKDQEIEEALQTLEDLPPWTDFTGIQYFTAQDVKLMIDMVENVLPPLGCFLCADWHNPYLVIPPDGEDVSVQTDSLSAKYLEAMKAFPHRPPKPPPELAGVLAAWQVWKDSRPPVIRPPMPVKPRKKRFSRRRLPNGVAPEE